MYIKQYMECHKGSLPQLLYSISSRYYSFNKVLLIFFGFFFLADPDNPFRKPMVSNIISREGYSASIPCLATDPSLENLQLKTCSSEALASGLQFSSSLEQGIIIHNTQKSYEGCYVCTGRLKEANVRSHIYHLTVRPGKKLDDFPPGIIFFYAGQRVDRNLFYFLPVPVSPPAIMLQAPKRVILIRDERLDLTCNTTNVNGDIKLKWVTPLGSVRPFCLLLSVCCPVGWTVEVENGAKSELVCSQCRFCMAYKHLFV